MKFSFVKWVDLQLFNQKSKARIVFAKGLNLACMDKLLATEATAIYVASHANSLKPGSA